ncbi:glycosyltransferase [Microvirga sp. CF3016]|uniref:glycosyltransferase n=1 Tax=Microvirga sp. CF3016 TaxID=3110181 RepID=UPI002E79B898|nr:glycosyltransferase [Microvirga sp. CF3016]MEE1610159.1 glycosyltransferase [Microvirga sp. CF3016]
MNPILTVGVTTHNERENINPLLDRLSRLDESLIHVILFDDASTDGTATLIAQHPISKKRNFQAQLAETNFGSPSVGRQFIASNAQSPYVTFVDGDDLINPKALMTLARRLAPGLDMIVTPFMIGPLRIFPKSFDNERPISSDTISRILSGIGGKIYNREALVLHTRDDIKGRSEDVRLNMRILLGGFDRVKIEDTAPFYFIATSRKSTLAKNILLHEIAARIQNYQVLKERYGINDTYVQTLHRNLLKVVREDASLSDQDRLDRYTALHDTMPFRLKTIIHLVQDPGQIGGIPGRVRNTVKAAAGRPIRHVCLAVQGDPTGSLPGTLSASDDPEGVLAFLGTCHATDTVVITPNNIIRKFPANIYRQLSRLPLLHMASGQLSFILQDTLALADQDYLDSYRVSRILCLSDMDMAFHRQLGIHDLTKIRLPVETRSHNGYDPEKNRFATYVGRIDFHTKGAERLVPIARLMQARGLERLRLFTTDGPNSPDLPAFLALLEEAGVRDWVEILYNVTDKTRLYGEASVVLLPSKKESFGNVILEAFSFGVPVIATSYAPGPAEVIRPGVDGFLLDAYSAEAVVDLLEGLTADRLVALSQAAFARHRDYSMEQYLAALEAIAAETARTFPGQNTLSPFPKMRAVEFLATQPVSTFLMRRYRVRERMFAWRVYLVERVLPWKVLKIIRWAKAKIIRK